LGIVKFDTGYWIPDAGRMEEWKNGNEMMDGGYLME